jgi:hypothetical protein
MRHTIVLALVLTAAAPVFAEGPADEEGIRRAYVRIAAAFGGDVTAESSIHPDIMFTNIFGSVFRGRADFIERHRYLGAVLFKGATAKQTIRRFLWVRPDVALVLAETVVTNVKNFPPGPYVAPDGTLHTFGLAVFTKEKDEWVMTAWHNTDVTPPTQ